MPTACSGRRVHLSMPVGGDVGYRHCSQKRPNPLRWQRNKDLKDLIKKTRKKATIIIQSVQPIPLPVHAAGLARSCQGCCSCDAVPWQAYDTKAMFEMAMAGKPFVENSGGGGKDAIWAEVAMPMGDESQNEPLTECFVRCSPVKRIRRRKLPKP